MPMACRSTLMHHAGRPTTPERFLSCRGTDIHRRRCSWPVSNHNACTIILQTPLGCQLPAQLCTCPQSAVCTVTAATEAAPILPSAKHKLSCQCVCAYRLPAIQRHLHRAVLHLCQCVGPQGLHHLLHPFHRLHHPHHSHSLHHHCPHLLPASSGGPQMVVAFIHVWRVYRSAALHCVLHIAYALCMMLHAPLHPPTGWECLLPCTCWLRRLIEMRFRVLTCVIAGMFIFGYCFYYYLARSDMSGFMQTSFFFCYMFMVCYAFFLMLGAVGYRSSLSFVRHIYK